MGRKFGFRVLTAVVLTAGLLAGGGPLLGRADASAHHATLTPDVGPVDPPGTLAAVPVPLSAQEPSRQAKVLEVYGKLPLHFEANQGQTDSRVKFLARGRGYTLFLTATEAVLALRPGGKAEGGKQKAAAADSFAKSSTQKSSPGIPQSTSGDPDSVVVRMRLIGANPQATMEGQEELPGKVNYFLGNDPTKWRTNVPTYAKVKYQGVYPGVDLVYYGNQRQLEYDLVVAPGADPSRIRLGFEGAETLEVDTQGDLLLKIAGCEIRLHKPRIYQEANGTKVPIPGAYILEKSGQLSANSAQRSTFRKPHSAFRNQVVGFQVAAYDLARPLIIDPVLSYYSTYLGGNGLDLAYGIAVDAGGNAYVTGGTRSSNFPTTPGAFQPVPPGGKDVFVTKLNPAGSALVYSTYLGGTDVDEGDGIAVDASGNAYVTGYTSSLDFPTTPGAFQLTPGGLEDAFVTKLDPTGSALVYSTYLGGTAMDRGRAIAVDAGGSAYVTGGSHSYDFPTSYGAFQRALRGADDAFVTKLSPDGSALVYSTYLGGTGIDAGHGIAVDAAGSAYVTGGASSDFPTTPGAFQTRARSTVPAFVTKLSPDGLALVYSTFLGGSVGESARGIAVHATTLAYVTGMTRSFDFPTTPLAFQRTYRPPSDAFVTVLSYDGSDLVSSTFLGGTGSYYGSEEAGYAIAVDHFGYAYVTGLTFSSDFPTTPDAFQPTYGGERDAFVTKLSPHSALVYSTYLGGTGVDEGYGIAVDAAGNFYVTGETWSRDFPTTKDAFQPAPPGWYDGDAFVAKFGPPGTETLSVSKSGTGSGTVTSNPPGIDCGTTCSELFEYGTSVTLTASPSPGSAFTRWEGDCIFSTPTCTVEMTQARSVTAVFSVVDAPRLTLSLNQPSFRPGETMILSATVTPGVTPRSVDVYVAIAIPGGTLLFLRGDGSFTTEMRPIVTGWAAAAFSGEIFRYTFSGGEPPGAYTWLAAFTQPGTLSFIGPIVSAPFTFSP